MVQLHSLQELSSGILFATSDRNRWRECVCHKIYLGIRSSIRKDFKCWICSHFFSRMKKDWITVYKCLKGSHMRTLSKTYFDSRGLLKQVTALKLVNNPSESAVYWIDMYVNRKKNLEWASQKSTVIDYNCNCIGFVRNCKNFSWCFKICC